MEFAYKAAVKELTEIRTKNQAEHDRRLNKVRLISDEYVKTEKALAAAGGSLVRLVADGLGDCSAIEAKIKMLRTKKAEILKSLNLPEDYLDDIYSCEKCRDTGYDENGDRCSCLKKLIARNIGKSSNMTESMHNQRFEKFNFSMFAAQPPDNGRDPMTRIKKIYDICRNFAEDFDTAHKNLLLIGNAGTGKTYISSCIANRALERGKSVYYQTAFNLFDALERLKFGRYTPEEQEDFEAVQKYINTADLLIIDDLGTEFISSYSSVMLFNIINNRLLNKQSTILSTNLSIENLTRQYSQRFVSRICGDYEILRFIGRDLRFLKYSEK